MSQYPQASYHPRQENYKKSNDQYAISIRGGQNTISQDGACMSKDCITTSINAHPKRYGFGFCFMVIGIVLFIFWPRKLILEAIPETNTLTLDIQGTTLVISGDVEMRVTNPNRNDIKIYNMDVTITYAEELIAHIQVPGETLVKGSSSEIYKETINESYSSGEAFNIVTTGISDCFGDNLADFIVSGKARVKYGIFPEYDYEKTGLVQVTCS